MNQLFAQNAFIESVTPESGYSGQLVSIKGQGLADADRVFFGAMEGTIISVADQLIEAEVPNGATYDNVTVFNSTTRLYYSGEHFLLSYGGEQGITSSDFDPQVDVFAQSGLYDVTISDLDGDGKNDVIGANSNANSATVLRNISTVGTISLAKTPFNLGATTLNSTAGDLNGDGTPEIVFSEGNDGNRIFILVNFSTPGNLSFTVQSLTINSSSTKRVVIKDLDLDGKPDLVISDQASNKILLVKNTSSAGSLSFSSSIVELTVDNAESTAGLDVEDLNGDGLPEIITNQFLRDGGGFYIATNQSSVGTFDFSGFTQYNTSGTLVNLKVGDLNGDDKPDIVATLFLSSSVAAFVNETEGIGSIPQFGSAQNITTDRRPWGIDFGDVDGDGNLDMAVATIGDDKTVNILNNTGSALDFSTISIPVDFIARNIKLADIDGDSKPDVVFTSVDDDNNNISSSNISILRNNKCIEPEILPAGPINACAGNPVRLEAQKIEGVTYEWRKDGVVVKTGTENFIELTTTAESGDYTVTIVSEGGSCSEQSEIVQVTITSSTSLPSASLTSNSPVCVGGTLTLTSTDVGADAYEWSGPQNFSASGISVDVTNFNAAKAGKYTLDVYSGSCIIESKTIIADVVYSPAFFVQQSGSGSYCSGESVQLTISPNDPDYTYQWFTEGGGAIAGATASSYNPTTSGNYYVEISDQVNTFCPKLYSDTLEVSFLDLPVASFDYPTVSCANTAITFSDDSEVADPSLAEFSWNFGDGSTSVQQNPVHSYAAPGTYDVTLEVSYNGFTNCSNQIIQQITINGNLDATINSSSSSICPGDSVVLSLDNTFEEYAWSTGASTSSIAVSDAGTYSVTVTDQNGCTGFAELTLRTFPSPDVQLTASNTTIVEGDTVTITATGLNSYTWYTNDESSAINSNTDQIQLAPEKSVTVIVEGQNENGCFGTAEITINVEEINIGDQITPMKFFSPNNDGIAQFWEIENITEFASCGVEVYDQQGNKIYESKPYNNDWEGYSNGSPVPDGVYYFVVRCDESGIVKQGSITLLR